MPVLHRRILILMTKRVFWYGAAAWEALRFIILYSHVMAVIDPTSRGISGLLLLWFGAAQLGLAALCFFAGADPREAALLRGLYLLAKSLTGLPALIYTAVKIGLTFLGEPPAALIPSAAVVLVDAALIAGACLGRPPVQPAAKAPDTSTLPDLDITRLEED